VVGTAVGQMLVDAGHRIVGVASRTDASAERASARWRAPVFAAETGLPPSDFVLIATSDDAIEAVATRSARHVVPGTVVCHFAGSLGTAPLHAVEAAGGRACALHPVASCPDAEAALRRLPGCAWGVTCGPELRAWAQELVGRDLRGHPVLVDEEDRAVWHVASVVTANGAAALMSAGEQLLARIGVAEPASVLAPLCAGVVANARQAGSAGAALTGPVVRREPHTLVRHVRALRERAPDLVETYVLATRTIVVAAQQAGRIDAAAGRAMERALEGT
jgi:predicted short-subunit dehydrogenase-like oxidoreductase (DUF2520 family)